MSPELQGIVTSHCYSRYVGYVPFFQPDLSNLNGYMRLKAEEEFQIFVTQVQWRVLAGGMELLPVNRKHMIVLVALASTLTVSSRWWCTL